MNEEELETNIKARQDEIKGYQVNIDNYTKIISLLDSDYPQDLEQYKGLQSVQIVEQVSKELQSIVGDMNFKLSLEKSLATEKLEQRKAKLILQALEER